MGRCAGTTLGRGCQGHSGRCHHGGSFWLRRGAGLFSRTVRSGILVRHL